MGERLWTDAVDMTDWLILEYQEMARHLRRMAAEAENAAVSFRARADEADQRAAVLRVNHPAQEA